MKVFITSDIHGRFDLLSKIVEFIRDREDIDCIILCGDITADHVVNSFNELEDRQYQDYKKNMKILHQLNKRVLFILGNHDVFNVDKGDANYLPYCNAEEFNKFVPIEYSNFIMYGTKREGNEQDMVSRILKLNIDNKSIIISHLPPYKCLDKTNNSAYCGSRAIRDMIKVKKPAYFFCGHVHNAFGFRKLYNTFVFNAACDETTARGWIVDLQTAKHEKIILY
ncbi:metallophosphoesterase [Clostridium sp. FP2]|uniref:metallophosphoesterase family protein n=1 Tax=Clostridium sp. FP2 TaxID=2724481 RepID=UPI0013E953D8|nr:metallophosphoesterase [Clostridium sp. FP2]MBZ9624422.1 metallophosphoesterase [Clostridium sp. FP2]